MLLRSDIERRMRMNYKNIFLIISTLISFNAYADSLDNQLQNTIHQYLNKNKNKYHLSAVQLSILLPNNNKPRDYVIGTQEFGKNKPATNHMLLQWGSITKEFTASLVFKLINEHKFKLTDNLEKILPEHFKKNARNPWPKAWGEINVAQLMNMTSGIPTYVDNNALIAMMQNKYFSMDDLVTIAKNKTLHCKVSEGCFYPSGKKWFYSNTNYIILGLIAEKYMGKPFSELMQEFILNPFIKTNSNSAVYYSTQKLPEVLLNNMVHGYIDNRSGSKVHFPKSWIDVTNDNLSLASSAGALFGNTNTMVRLIYALYHDKIIPPTSQLEQYQVEVPSGKIATNLKTQCDTHEGCFAMGVRMLFMPNQGGEIFYYQGGTLGYNAIYFWIPSENVVIGLSLPIAQRGDWPLIQFALKINTQIRRYLQN